MSVKIKGHEVIRMIADDLTKANVMAINRASTGTAAEVRKTVRAKYNIKQADLSPNSGHGIKVTRATGNKPVSLMSIPHRPFGLVYFNARQPKRGNGVTYEMLRGQRKTRLHAFLVNVTRVKDRNQEEADQKFQVFERYGDKSMSKTRKNKKGFFYMMQRIRPVRTQSIAQMFLGSRGTTMMKATNEIFSNRYQIELLRASKFLRSKRVQS